MDPVEALATAASLLDALGILGILQGACIVLVALVLARKLLSS